ncbi:hypothetical protein V5H41_29865, partial [Salmonella enterica]
KIVLMHTPAVLTETVADTVMALMLATARRVVASPQNSPDAHACRFDGNRCRYGDGVDAGHCPPRGGV